MKPQVRSVAFDLCIFLVRNPGAAIFAGEITQRWGTPQPSLWRALKAALSLGYIERFKVKGERQFCYTAGPKLKEGQ